MSTRTIKIGCGYNGDLTTFSLRAISIAEENQFSARFADISDSETADHKDKLEYDILVDSLAAWATEPLMKKNDDGETVKLFGEEIDAAGSIRKFFEDDNIDNRRLANSLVLNYRSKLQPDVVFY